MRQNSLLFCTLAWARGRVICQAEQIVNTRVIKECQLDQNLIRNVAFAQFILRERVLCNTQVFGNLRLAVFLIIPKVSDSIIFQRFISHFDLF